MTDTKKYDFKELEEKWSQKWGEERLFQDVQAVDGEKRSYVLGMFPYPSGEGLHTGHGRIFTACDVLGRYQRMKGYKVLLPMGWDAFGLPAENAAIKAKTNPMKLVPHNEANFKRQMQMLGFSYDWTREFSTTDPNYYKWTQWLFLKLYGVKNKKGKRLIYREEVPINWCTQCKTGIANEEVLSDGTHERCGKIVAKKLLPQWVMRITDYADRLLEDLDTTEWTDADGKKHVGLDWPKGILEMQRNWIGKKEGINIHYQVEDGEGKLVALDPGIGEGQNGGGVSGSMKNKPVEVVCFTTRPDTNFGATFVVVAPEYELVKRLIRGELTVSEKVRSEVKAYVDKALAKTEQQRLEEGRKKTGVFSGLFALNRLTGYKMPIYVSDFVLAGFGTGAVVGVPGHDRRDWEFAREFEIPIKQVVRRVNLERWRSYLMGAQQISDRELTDLGIIIAGRVENSRKLEIPKEALSKYEQLIIEKMTPGFWNEYVGEEVVFIFKFPDGRTERIVLTDETNDWINRLAGEFNHQEPDKVSVWTWLTYNDWYTEMLIQEDDGLMINSEFLDGMDIHEATKKIIDYLEKKGWAERVHNYHLRDWVFSRQRYWGEPFPLVYCEKCADKTEQFDVYEIDHKKYAVVPVPESQLPVKLPELLSYEPTDTGESPLSRVDEWMETKCPVCGGPARRETDTMPNWAGSCWYFLRFAMKNKIEAGEDLEEEWKSALRDNAWLPVQWYLGGAEHAVLHLLYARFWVKVFQDLELLEFGEPFLRLRSVGMVLAEDGRKMSKSLGNVVNPDEVVKKYGADAVRIYEMFMGPWDQAISWDIKGLVGCKRFVEKVWGLYHEVGRIGEKTSPDMVGMVQRTIRKVGDDIGELKFNTAIAALMELMNAWRGEGGVLSTEDAVAVLKLLAPFAPFMTEEMYQIIRKYQPSSTKRQGELRSVHEEGWPEYDLSKSKEAVVEIPVQVNGKLRGKIQVISNKLHDKNVQAELFGLAREDGKVRLWVEGKQVVKEIWVPGKLINLVVR